MSEVPNVRLVQPCLDHVEALLSFELSNRPFFEAHVNARPASYYSTSGVVAAIDRAIDEAHEDLAYQFLVVDRDEKLVGRINLTRVRRAHFHSAEVGYRVAEAECGKGYAGEAVRQAVIVAFEEKALKRIEASARPENVGSVQVLLRNGFVPFGRSSRSFELDGIWYDRLHFEKHA
jgi:ribosomal-protein-alanine N-acetyltransferase